MRLIKRRDTGGLGFIYETSDGRASVWPYRAQGGRQNRRGIAYTASVDGKPLGIVFSTLADVREELHERGL